MVLKETTKESPTLGEVGKPTIPETLQITSGALSHAPEINMEALHAMFKKDGQVAGLWRMLTTPLRSSKLFVMRPHRRANTETNFIQEIFTENVSDVGMRHIYGYGIIHNYAYAYRWMVTA